MPISLTLDKGILFVGDTVNLSASFNVSPSASQVLLTVGVLRPDGATEYPLYLQTIQAPPPPTPPSTTPAPFQGSLSVPYVTKLFGFHRGFAHIYVYNNGQITQEMTGEVWLLVLPVLILPPT